MGSPCSARCAAVSTGAATPREMTNPYYLVVETPDANLSRGMRQLNGVYTQMTHRRHGRVGHLFQGRFKAILVERDAYLLELARYVLLNPVRAGRVPEAGDWPWSNYRAMVGQTSAPAWLETDWVLGQFGPERSRAQASFAAFVRQGIGQPSVWERLREVPRVQGRSLAEPLADLAYRLPRRARGHGAGLPNRGLLHAGDCRPFRRAIRGQVLQSLIQPCEKLKPDKASIKSYSY